MNKEIDPNDQISKKERINIVRETLRSSSSLTVGLNLLKTTY